MQVTDGMVRVAVAAYTSQCDGWYTAGAAPMRAALTAALAAMWQDIKDAPRDGTRVLLRDDNGWDPSELCTGWWENDQWRDYGDVGCNGIYPYEPTHFMPLPALPAKRNLHNASD